jgi:hypothetical protein
MGYPTFFQIEFVSNSLRKIIYEKKSSLDPVLLLSWLLLPTRVGGHKTAAVEPIKQKP